jgi:hypothetical protein
MPMPQLVFHEKKIHSQSMAKILKKAIKNMIKANHQGSEGRKT